MKLKPNLDMLPEAQKNLWPYLKEVPKEFVLYGGTAVALRYGHRESVDFDFFTTAPIDVHAVSQELTFMNNKNIVSGAINHPDIAIGNNIKIASPLALMACKILALCDRTEEKDFIDIGELLKNKVSLQKGFEGAIALARFSPVGAGRINLYNLKADLEAKTVTSMLPNRPDYVELINKEAAKLNIDKALKTKIKIIPNNYKSKSLER